MTLYDKRYLVLIGGEAAADEQAGDETTAKCLGDVWVFDTISGKWKEIIPEFKS